MHLGILGLWVYKYFFAVCVCVSVCVCVCVCVCACSNSSWFYTLCSNQPMVSFVWVNLESNFLTVNSSLCVPFNRNRRYTILITWTVLSTNVNRTCIWKNPSKEWVWKNFIQSSHFFRSFSLLFQDIFEAHHFLKQYLKIAFWNYLAVISHFHVIPELQ